MLRVTVKGLLAYKLRMAMNALAVVLGVAFVAGFLVFTDTLDKTFTELTRNTAPADHLAVLADDVGALVGDQPVGPVDARQAVQFPDDVGGDRPGADTGGLPGVGLHHPDRDVRGGLPGQLGEGLVQGVGEHQ